MVRRTTGGLNGPVLDRKQSMKSAPSGALGSSSPIQDVSARGEAPGPSFRQKDSFTPPWTSRGLPGRMPRERSTMNVASARFLTVTKTVVCRGFHA